MSSFFDEASLVMIPSGYKNQKVYSVKPLDGSGDLTFSRASSATRVASNGLIEKVRTNIFPTGSALTTAIWDNVGATLTTGQVDPNGGTGAMRVQLAGGSVNYIAQVFTNSSVSFTRSVFIKAATAQTIRLVEPNTGGNVLINLTTSYQRFTLSVNGSGSSFGIRFDNENDSAAKDFTIAFIQLETGDIATDYIPTTTAAVSVGPVSGLPRLDYLNSSCPRLLLEPQRTNLITYSEQFNNAAWFNSGTSGGTSVTITANSGVAPDGTTSAELIAMTRSTTSGSTYISQTQSTSAGVHTSTIYLKAKDATHVGKQISAWQYDGAERNLVDITLTASWVRYSLLTTSSLPSGTNELLAFGFRSGRGTTTSVEFYAWGAQGEAGAYATSYIPTLGTSVTRVAEFANKGSISSLFGATEGTFFCELTYTDVNSIPIFLQSSVSSSFNQATYLQMGGNKVTYNVYSGGSQQVGITSTSNFTEGQNLKIAIVYKANDFVMYINGVAEGAVSSGSISNSLTAIQIGRWDDAGSTFQYFGRLRQAILFPTRLSNSDLAALTA